MDSIKTCFPSLGLKTPSYFIKCECEVGRPAAWLLVMGMKPSSLKYQVTNQALEDDEVTLTEKILQLLKLWNCKINRVNSITTTSNTGQVTAVCLCNRHWDDWAACQHIGEVIIAQMFAGLKIEASKLPEVSMFSRFRKHFESLPYTHKEALTFLDSSYFN